MTRGQHGLLLLYCKRLSLSVTHRFAPAHRPVKKLRRTITASRQASCDTPRSDFSDRLRPLTLVGPGNMVKFFRFTTEHTVNFILQPWQLFVMILASWVHREQQTVIEFYQDGT